MSSALIGLPCDSGKQKTNWRTQLIYINVKWERLFPATPWRRDPVTPCVICTQYTRCYLKGRNKTCWQTELISECTYLFWIKIYIQQPAQKNVRAINAESESWEKRIKSIHFLPKTIRENKLPSQHCSVFPLLESTSDTKRCSGWKPL